jgi:hypothetical protein
MFLPSRDKLVWDYFDASDDPLAQGRCEVPDTVTVTLDRLGFERLGHALAVFRMNRMELVHEVWTSDDGVTLAEVTASSGRVSLLTLFEDGTIVKTSVRPPLFDWIYSAPGTRWPRAAQLTHAYVTGPLDDVLARHRDRVAETKKTPIPATMMQTYFAMRIRQGELLVATIYPQLMVAIVLSTVLSLAITLPFLRVYVHRHGKSPGAVLLAMIGATIVLLPTQHVAKWFIAPYIVRLRSGPPPRDAETLCAVASEVPSGRVYRY